MFKWLKALLGIKKELIPKTSILTTPVGFNKVGRVTKETDYNCECMECGERWDYRKHKSRTSYSYVLYERCSRCLDITTVNYSQTETGKKDIHITGIEDVPR